MKSRSDLIKSLIRTAKTEFSYSAVMRKLRKDEPEKVSQFMKSFKSTFDEALINEFDDPENIALMQAIKTTKVDCG